MSDDIYKDEIELVTRIIEYEKVPTKNPKAIAKVAVLVASYGAGDMLAGLSIERAFSNSEVKNEWKNWFKRQEIDIERFSCTSLQIAFEKLGKKYPIFKALSKMSVSGGHTTSIKELAKKYSL